MEFHLAALWLVAFALLTVLGQPIAARLFPRFPDRGSAFGLPLALAVLGLVAFWLGRLSLTLGTWGGLGVLLGLAAVLLWRGHHPDPRAVGETLAVFTVAFVVMVAFRALDPSAHAAGGEKFLDFGLLRSLLRAASLPAEDFWFAGEPLRYYYGGHLVGSVVARLTSTSAAYAYNLLLAGYFATLVVAAYGLGGALVARRTGRGVGDGETTTAGVERSDRRPGRIGEGAAGFLGTLLAVPAFCFGLVVRAGAFCLLVPLALRARVTGTGGRSVERVRATLRWRDRLASLPLTRRRSVREVLSPSRRRTASVLAAVLVCVTGTLVTPARLLLGVAIREFDLAPEWRQVAGEAVFEAVRAPLPDLLASQTDPLSFSYWYGRYVVPDAITVFPFWEWINGDLHAHLMSTPFLLTVAALLLAYYRTPATRRGRRWLLLGVVALLSGLLAVVNLWSLPTALGLAGLAVALAPGHPVTLTVGGFRSTGSRALDELTRPFAALSVVALLGSVAVLVGSPFLLVNRPVNRGIGVLPPRSGLVPLVLVYGTFLAVFAGAALARLRGRLGTPATAAVGLVGLGGVLAASAADLAAVGLVGPLLVGGWALARSTATRDGSGWRERVSRGARSADGGFVPAPFEPVLVVAGAGLVLAVEFAYAKVWPHDPNAVRWNTVYKVSMQVWLLWGVAAGGLLARALAALHLPAFRFPENPGFLTRLTGAWTVRVGVTLLLVSAGTFGVLAGGWQLADPYVSYNDSTDDLSWRDGEVDATLDATRVASRWHPQEAEAIEWLNERRGTPTLVSMPGFRSPAYDCVGVYRWQNAPSTFSGVPTLAGWEHERGYRGDEAYAERVAAAVGVYAGSWANATRTFREYDVEYVYVGPTERACFGEDLRSFGDREWISTAFRAGNVTIYEVGTVPNGTGG
jgi:YYY domain-containing protein